MENLPFFSLVFLRKRRRWAFFKKKTRFRPWIHQPSESFGLTLATETTFNSNFCSKTARYRLFLAVVRCCVTTTLAAETFGLLNVYLNYKFGLGLPSLYLFFSLLELVHARILWICVQSRLRKLLSAAQYHKLLKK